MEKYIIILNSIMIACLATIVFASSVSAETILAVTDDYPPFVYREDGKPVGVAIDIVRELFKETETEGTIRFYPWKRAYAMGLKNRNTLVFTMSRTPERESLFKWIGPLFTVKVGLYRLRKRSDIHVRTLEDAKRYYVGTVRGYASEKKLLNAGFEIGKNIDRTSDEIKNVKKLLAHRFDLICSTDLVLAYYLRKEGHRLDETEKVVTLSGQFDEYMGFNKETDDSVVENFNKAFDRIKQNGVYDKIISKYIQ